MGLSTSPRKPKTRTCWTILSWGNERWWINYRKLPVIAPSALSILEVSGLERRNSGFKWTALIYLQVLANLVENGKSGRSWNQTKASFFQLNHQLVYMRSKRSSLISDPKMNQWIVRFGRCLCPGGFRAFLPKGESKVKELKRTRTTGDLTQWIA